MKKRIITIFLILMFFTVDATVNYYKKRDTVSVKSEKEEIKAIYISYLEYYSNFYGGSQSMNKKKIDQMIEIVKSHNLNTIILHVSPFSDSIYNSKIFPFSETLTGQEGKNPGFDYLEYFIKRAHQNHISIFAWINPYRISFQNDYNKISKNNPAYSMIGTSNILADKNGIYYNPASEIVKNLIINQVKEIIKNYDVDGIHFDDYFYIQKDIDRLEYHNYQQNGGKLSLKDFRLSQTNDLIKKIYHIIKEKNNKIQFSIAPDGNINNNYLYHFADIKTWLKDDGYVDIIMPQIYYGFKNDYSPFYDVLNNWINLCQNEKIKIVPVLAYYKIGTVDNEAGGGKNEWIDDDVINKQMLLIKHYNLSGFAWFRYDYVVKNS